MGAARMGVQKAAQKPLRGIKAVGKSLPVGEVAYASLKQAIVKGDLHPGQRLVESKLSAQMLISRIPVREAIKKLEQDGLVEKLAKGGFIVKNPSREEIEETFGIRAVLEGFAAALATTHMNQAILKRLEVTLEWYRDALNHGDTAKMIRLNDQLDDIIFGASGNRRLCALIGNFRDFISRYRRVLLTCLDYAAISLADHEKIVGAMKEGDPEKVEQLMRRHLTRGKEILIRDMTPEKSFEEDREETLGNTSEIRVLIAKPGLDGHDRGAKVVAHALKEAGMEVIYTGLHKTVDQIIRIAIQEDVDVIGLSIMSGAHLPIVEKLMKLVGQEGIGDKMVIVGGVIPNKDIERLKALGVAGVFPGDTRFSEIVAFITENVGQP